MTDNEMAFRLQQARLLIAELAEHINGVTGASQRPTSDSGELYIRAMEAIADLEQNDIFVVSWLERSQSVDFGQNVTFTQVAYKHWPRWAEHLIP